jgi:orotidine-5'-phosphate decarboxylase
MTRAELVKQIRDKQSCLCVGLDSELDKIPSIFPKSSKGLFAFNKKIIDVTRDYCVAYKLNTAFYEVLGADGWAVLKETIEYIGNGHFVIADAKRGDIGNTAKQYAKAFFDHLNADAITLNPYMGSETILPFLKYENKWSIILALTSNSGARDFQWLSENSDFLFKKVVDKMKLYSSSDNCMFVVGGTRPDDLKIMRKLCPNHFFLVPGVGKQGGTVSSVMNAGRIKDDSAAGLIINSSRSILFASQGKNFAIDAAKAASKLQKEMAKFID